MLRILHGDNTPLIASALSPNGKLIALSNLTKDISILNFPTGIPELENDYVSDALSVEKDKAKNSFSERDQSSFEQTLINLNDLDENEKRQMTAQELSAYSVAENNEFSKDHSEQQIQLNKLLKSKNRITMTTNFGSSNRCIIKKKTDKEYQITFENHFMRNIIVKAN